MLASIFWKSENIQNLGKKIHFLMKKSLKNTEKSANIFRKSDGITMRSRTGQNPDMNASTISDIGITPKLSHFDFLQADF